MADAHTADPHTAEPHTAEPRRAGPAPLRPRRHARARPPAAPRPVARAALRPARSCATRAAAELRRRAAHRPARRPPGLPHRVRGRPGRTASCGPRRAGSRTCSPGTSASSRATGCCCAAPTHPVAGRLLVRRCSRPGAVAVTALAACCARTSWRTICEIARRAARAGRDVRRPPTASARGGRRAGRHDVRRDAPDDLADAHGRPARRSATPCRPSTAGRRGPARVHLRHHRAPQGAMHFHRDVLAIADTFSAARAARRAPDDLFAGHARRSASPSASAGCVVFPMRAGASALLLEQAAPRSCCRLVAEHRVSVPVHRADRPTGRCCSTSWTRTT